MFIHSPESSAAVSKQKSHPRNKLLAQLPHEGTARRRRRDFRKTPDSWELVTFAPR